MSSVDDASLVRAMLGRDPAGLEGAYRRYADQLYTYARSLTGDRDAAIDIVHDTFLLATERVGQLRDPDRLRPWLYAIARSVGLRHLRRQARHAPLEAAGEVKADTVDLLREVQAGGVADLVRAAMGGLSERDAEIVGLAVRHRLAAPDVASVLGLPLNHAHARLSRAREQLLVCLGVLLVARESRCAGLTPLLSGWDGTLNPLLRKRLHRHIDGCATCGSIRSTRLDPSALLASFASLPFLAVPTVLFGQSSPSAVPFLRDLPSPASPSPGGTPTPGGGPTGGTSPSTPGPPASPGGTSPSHGGPPGGTSPSHGGTPASPGGAPGSEAGTPAAPGGAPGSEAGTPAASGGAPGSEAGTPAAPGGAPGSEGGAPGSLGGTSPSTHGGTPPAAPGDAGDKFAPGSHRSTPSGQGRSPSTPAIRWGKDGFPVQPAVGGSSRKAVIAVAAGVAAAIVIAVCGTAILHNGRSGTPDTVVTLDAVVLSQSPAPDGTSPAASPPKSTGTPALAFTATGSAICIGGLDYKVTVNVTANAVLATATFYRPGATPMTVAGKTATVTVSVFGGSSLAWHVRVVAADGRALTGPNRTTANPCP